MATLKVRELRIGGIYVDPLSGKRMRVKQRTVAGVNTPCARAEYWNDVSGKYEQVEIRDGVLEEVTTSKSKR